MPLMPNSESVDSSSDVAPTPTPTLVHNKLESGKNIAVYKPQGVQRQFGYDQGLETNLAQLLWSLRLILWLQVTLDPPGGSEVVLPAARASRCNVISGRSILAELCKGPGHVRGR